MGIEKPHQFGEQRDFFKDTEQQLEEAAAPQPEANLSREELANLYKDKVRVSPLFNMTDEEIKNGIDNPEAEFTRRNLLELEEKKRTHHTQW